MRTYFTSVEEKYVNEIFIVLRHLTEMRKLTCVEFSI